MSPASSARQSPQASYWRSSEILRRKPRRAGCFRSTADRMKERKRCHRAVASFLVAFRVERASFSKTSSPRRQALALRGSIPQGVGAFKNPHSASFYFAQWGFCFSLINVHPLIVDGKDGESPSPSAPLLVVENSFFGIVGFSHLIPPSSISVFHSVI